MNAPADPPAAGSRLRIFEIGADRYLHPVTSGEPSPDWLSDETDRWITGWDYSLSEIEALCQSCGIELPSQVIDGIRNPPLRPNMIRHENLLFASYSIEHDGAARLVIVLCAPTTIVTIHESGELVGEVRRDCQQERRLRGAAPLAVLLELIEAALQRLIRRIFDLRQTILARTDALEAGTEEVDSEVLLGLKQDATTLEIQLEDLSMCLMTLANYESEVLKPEEVKPLVLHMERDVARTLNSLVRLKSRIEDMHQFQVRSADETTNRRLKVLTILSAVYMPPTLIAGIYGMNFGDIPITAVPHGYGIVIGIMAALVIVQLVFFYKSGWFD